MAYLVVIKRDGREVHSEEVGHKHDAQFVIMQWIQGKHSFSYSWAEKHEGYSYQLLGMRECCYCFKSYPPNKQGLSPDDGSGGNYHCGDCKHPYGYDQEVRHDDIL